MQGYMVKVVCFEHNYLLQLILLLVHALARRYASTGNENTTLYTGVGVPTDIIIRQLVKPKLLNILRCHATRQTARSFERPSFHSNAFSLSEKACN